MFVPDSPTILHADVDAFFASVEQRDDAGLRGRPVIVGGGVVMAASYEARAFGVRGAMGITQARRLCPDLVTVAPRFSAYMEASHAVFDVFRETAPIVEGLSLEEAFLDVRGLERICGPPEEIAARLRRTVREQVGLPLSVGVARRKVVAKLASRAAKPDGLLVVPADGELAFLHPLPVERVWGVGPATAAKLHAYGIRTVGDAARHTHGALCSILGPAAGGYVYAVAHNRDPSPVRRRRRGRRSMGAQSALGRPRRSLAELDRVLIGLVDRVTRRMRRAGRTGRTVVLRLRFSDRSRCTRSHTMPRATASTQRILASARGLLAAAMPVIEREGVTLVGITLTNLDGEGASAQLSLPLDGRDAHALDAAIDDVRERFGSAAVTRAILLRGDAQQRARAEGADPRRAKAPDALRADGPDGRRRDLRPRDRGGGGVRGPPGR